MGWFHLAGIGYWFKWGCLHPPEDWHGSLCGGDFTDAGGDIDADYLARWDGEDWHAVAPGVNRAVFSIDTMGPDLIAAGDFYDAGGNASCDSIALWDGFAWQPLGEGLNATVLDVVVVGDDIYAGGRFVQAGGLDSADFIARWGEGPNAIFLPVILNSP